MRIEIEKYFDENERVHEAPNGRLYVSTRGRWQWAVVVDGETVAVFDLAREARERAADVRRAADLANTNGGAA